MNFFYAFLAAVAFHAMLGVSVALYIECSDGPDEPAKLDLSAVELSIAEEERESAKAPSPAMPPAEQRPPRPVEAMERPDLERSDEAVFEHIPDIEPIAVPDAAVPAPPKMDIPEAPRSERGRGSANEADLTPQSPAAVSNESVSDPGPAPVQAKIDVMPKLRRAIRPKYPRASRERGEEGAARLRLEIDAQGIVVKAEVVVSTGFRLLDEAAVNAVKAAKFIPAKLRGEAVTSTAEIKLDFKLD